MTIYAISDLHFDHTSCIYKHKNPDGTFLREKFWLGGPNPTNADREAATKRMNDYIITMINAVVRPQDHLYIVGDVGMSPGSIKLAHSLHCHKTLIGGNHDVYKLKKYLDAGFKEVRGVRVLNHVCFTHIPIHESCMWRFIGNAHGHIHTRPSPEGPYYNLSCEVLDYRPVSLEDITMVLAAKNPDKAVHEEEIARMKESAEEIAMLEADE